MYTLILDSSNVNLSIGIAKDNKIIDEISYEAWQRQSELMIPELEKLMKKNNITRNDIKEVVASIGPGSYTGVRIALTIAKVMVLALNIPLYTISSLHAMKDGNNASICVINARSSRSYIGVYEGSNVLMSDRVMTNEEVLSYINEHPTYSLMGDASYLGKEGKTPDLIKGMLSLKEDCLPVEDALGVTPVYLKD